MRIPLHQLPRALQKLRFAPHIPHVVALARVVPALQLDHVGLLREPVREGVLAAAVPVLRGREVLELHGGQAHDEDARGLVRGGVEVRVLCGGYGCAAGGWGGLGVPVEYAVEGGPRGEEIRAWGGFVEAGDYEDGAGGVLEGGPLGVWDGLAAEGGEEGFGGAGCGVVEVEV